MRHDRADGTLGMKLFEVGPRGLASCRGAREACRTALREGALLVYPTDTLYALGGLALLEGVATRVAGAKRRAPDKALPIVAADWQQVGALAPEMSELAERLARRFWPGPLSLVLRAGSDIPHDVRAGGATVAVRVPDCAVTRELCALAGPLVATSANLSGRSAPITCREATADLAEEVAVAIDAGPASQDQPSTLVDVSERAPRLVREGAISWARIIDALR